MARRKSPKKLEANLTPKQLRLLTFVRDFRHAKGYSPTMQELADEFEVSKVTVFEHVEALQRKGFLERLPHKARSLQIKEGYEFPDQRPTMLPLAGYIAAGRPIEAIQNDESLDLEDMFASRGRNFVLKVRGDSMIDDQIRDGDFVVVEKRETARNGETVVALLDDGNATLKRFYREKEGVRLQPANPKYQPIITKNVSVQGIVVGVIRRL